MYRNFITIFFGFTLVVFSGCRQEEKIFQKEIAGPYSFTVDPDNRGMQEEWFRPDFDRTSWRSIQTLGLWDEYDLQSYDGVGWYACAFELPPLARPEMALVCSGVNDNAEVWVNGAHVGGHQGENMRFVLDLTGHTRQGGNLLVVRVKDTGGPGGLNGTIALQQFRRLEDVQRDSGTKVNP